jgi:hypothetical protein
MKLSSRNRNRKKKSRNPQKIIIILLGLFVLLFFGLIIKLYFWFTDVNNDNQYGLASMGDFSSAYQVNIYIKPNWIFGIDSKNNLIKYLQVENNQTKSLYDLSQKLKVKIDGFIDLSTELETENRIVNYLLNASFNSNLQSNLSRFQILQLWFGIRSNPIIKLESQVNLPEIEIIDANYSISILNATNIPGIGNNLAVWLDNFGAKVIEVGNSSQTYETSEIYVYKNFPGNAIYRRMQTLLNCPIYYNIDEKIKTYDIQIIIGSDQGETIINDQLD